MRKSRSRHSARLWGAGFAAVPDAEVLAFMSGRDVQSTPGYDEALVPYDLWGSRAHVLMLQSVGLIPSAAVATILSTLDEFEKLWLKKRIALDPALEDIHTHVEAFLTRKLGEDVAGHLHTGRSRNDQVCLDLRLFMRDQLFEATSGLADLAHALLEQAAQHRETLMPGFSHHRHATPTTLGYVLSAYAWPVIRTAAGLAHWLSQYNRSPLGAAAGYGTTLPIDREATSRWLGFDEPEPHGLDPISSRGEPEAALVFALACVMNALSGLAQSLILLSTPEFGIVRIGEAFCAGSSLMPQKRNPQVLEAVKAKAASVRACLVSILDLNSANLFGYNSDQQWIKYPLMDACREAIPSFRIMARLVRGIEVDKRRARALASGDFAASTALAEALVAHHGIPFRIAKDLVSQAVAASAQQGASAVLPKALQEAARKAGIDLALADQQVRAYQDVRRIVRACTAAGGSSPERVSEAVSRATNWIAETSGFVATYSQRAEEARRETLRACDQIISPMVRNRRSSRVSKKTREGRPGRKRT